MIVGMMTMMMIIIIMTMMMMMMHMQVDLRVTTYELEESGVNLTLTVAESMGFGDQINRVCTG